MKLRKQKATEINKIHKATVHTSGKLGFTRDAAEYLSLSSGKSLTILMNEDDESDKNLYIKVNENQNDQDAFKVSKAGDYFYTNLKYFYKHHNEEYEKGGIIYDINKTTIDGEEYFLFKRKKDDEIDEEE